MPSLQFCRLRLRRSVLLIHHLLQRNNKSKQNPATLLRIVMVFIDVSNNSLFLSSKALQDDPHAAARRKLTFEDIPGQVHLVVVNLNCLLFV